MLCKRDIVSVYWLPKCQTSLAFTKVLHNKLFLIVRSRYKHFQLNFGWVSKALRGKAGEHYLIHKSLTTLKFHSSSRNPLHLLSAPQIKQRQKKKNENITLSLIVSSSDYCQAKACTVLSEVCTESSRVTHLIQVVKCDLHYFNKEKNH